MLRGFYTAASGMISQQRQQEALANNIANANTPGYKADQPTLRAFPELLMRETGSQNIPTKYGLNVPVENPVGPLNTGVYVHEIIPNYDQGDIRETNQPTDLAIVNGVLPDEAGGLFFTVQHETGDVRYTRNGQFTVDGDGFLTTSQGYYVLDEMGNPIQTGGMDFDVTEDGVLQVDGQAIPLDIRYTDNVHALTKEGAGLLAGDAGVVPAGATFSIRQGFLERSNVDAAKTMTQMMEAYRMFETNQRVLKAHDESMDKAVNDIARIT